jgi:hypothetical protein
MSDFGRAILWGKIFEKLIFGGVHEKHDTDRENNHR